MAGSCKYCDELPGSINGEEFLEELNASLASQEGVCFLEIVSVLITHE